MKRTELSPFGLHLLSSRCMYLFLFIQLTAYCSRSVFAADSPNYGPTHEDGGAYEEHLWRVGIIHRHGARTPLAIIDNVVHCSQAPHCQLTAVGIAECRAVGRWARRRYHASLFPPCTGKATAQHGADRCGGDRDRHDYYGGRIDSVVTSMSTSLERVVQSAAAFVMGLMEGDAEGADSDLGAALPHIHFPPIDANPMLSPWSSLPSWVLAQRKQHITHNVMDPLVRQLLSAAELAVLAEIIHLPEASCRAGPYNCVSLAHDVAVSNISAGLPVAPALLLPALSLVGGGAEPATAATHAAHPQRNISGRSIAGKMKALVARFADALFGYSHGQPQPARRSSTYHGEAADGATQHTREVTNALSPTNTHDPFTAAVGSYGRLWAEDVISFFEQAIRTPYPPDINAFSMEEDDSAAAAHPSPRMKHYAAHDWTISAVFGTLGVVAPGAQGRGTAANTSGRQPSLPLDRVEDDADGGWFVPHYAEFVAAELWKRTRKGSPSSSHGANNTDAEWVVRFRRGHPYQGPNLTLAEDPDLVVSEPLLVEACLPQPPALPHAGNGPLPPGFPPASVASPTLPPSSCLLQTFAAGVARTRPQSPHGLHCHFTREAMQAVECLWSPEKEALSGPARAGSDHMNNDDTTRGAKRSVPPPRDGACVFFRRRCPQVPCGLVLGAIADPANGYACVLPSVESANTSIQPNASPAMAGRNHSSNNNNEASDDDHVEGTSKKMSQTANWGDNQHPHPRVPGDAAMVVSLFALPLVLGLFLGLFACRSVRRGILFRRAVALKGSAQRSGHASVASSVVISPQDEELHQLQRETDAPSQSLPNPQRKKFILSS